VHYPKLRLQRKGSKSSTKILSLCIVPVLEHAPNQSDAIYLSVSHRPLVPFVVTFGILQEIRASFPCHKGVDDVASRIREHKPTSLRGMNPAKEIETKSCHIAM
jgi:hypothetical protein